MIIDDDLGRKLDEARAQLAERDRLREEVAALKAQIEDVDHECKRQLETDRYKAALGRAHAAASVYHGRPRETCACSLCDALLDEDGRAAGEMLAALEREHDQMTRDRCMSAAVADAHAAVEALRGK